MKENLNASAHDSKTFCRMLWFQLCILGKALSYSSMTVPQCTKQGPQRRVWMGLVWKNLTGSHRALTSTALNTVWYELEWRLWTRTSWPKSVPDLIHALLDEWSTFQNGQNTPKSCGEPSQKSRRCYSCKGVTNSILMSTYLKCSVIKVPFGMVRCSNMFVHIV